MTRMVDVARHAGVSVKTVSRVINNEPHVQDALREKVRASVAELGYIPSTSARSLRSSRSYTIHMISEDAGNDNTFANAIQFGAMREAQRAGYRIALSLMNEADQSSDAAIADWVERISARGKPDGVVLVPPMANDARINAALMAAGIQVVRIGPNDIADSRPTILIDDHAAAREATQHLISLGHRRIAFVRGKEHHMATPLRFEGYLQAMEDAGLSVDMSLVMQGNFNFESGLAAGDKLLERDDRPTAVFASNDDMAAGVLVAAHRIGLKVPEELSIMGFDDTDMAARMWPALSTVSQPLKDFGSEAIRALVAGAGNDPEDGNLHHLPYMLITRASTGPAPAT